MPLRPLPYREVKRKLEAAGFRQVSRKGSHIKFASSTDAGIITVIVPSHHEVTTGTIRSIVRQAGMTPESFEAL